MKTIAFILCVAGIVGAMAQWTPGAWMLGAGFVMFVAVRLRA